MAGNGMIRMLRGTSDKVAESTGKLEAGQPLYITDKNYLTVGDGTKNVKAKPITVREVQGWWADNDNISAKGNADPDYIIGQTKFLKNNLLKIESNNYLRLFAGDTSSYSSINFWPKINNTSMDNPSMELIATNGISFNSGDGSISATCSNAEISIPKEALNPYVKINIDRDDAFDTSPQIIVYKNTLEISDTIIPIGSKSSSSTETQYAWDIGNSDNKYETIYANKFIGVSSAATNLVGTVSTNSITLNIQTGNSSETSNDQRISLSDSKKYYSDMISKDFVSNITSVIITTAGGGSITYRAASSGTPESGEPGKNPLVIYAIRHLGTTSIKNLITFTFADDDQNIISGNTLVYKYKYDSPNNISKLKLSW